MNIEPKLPSSRQILKKATIARFARSLGIALFDRKLELAGHSLLFFYDADVVVHMISGFDRPRSEGSDQQLVQSLLACHLLGRVSILRPHLLEVDNTLRTLPRPTSVADLKGFQLRARSFLESQDINEVMGQLHDIVNNHELGQKDKTARFLEVLGQSAGKTFVEIEQFSGTWVQRLSRFNQLGLLDFDHLGPEMADLFEESRQHIFEIFDIIKMYRPKDRDQNLRDSAALTIVRKMIQNHQADPRLPLPRFYTDTEKLKEACFNDPALRKLLKQDALTDREVPEDAGLAIRDSWYFIMRARFESLALGGGQGQQVGIAELEELYSKLNDLLATDGIEITEKLELIDFNGQRLPDVIEQFEQLALMRSIWVRHRIPDYVIEAFPHWTDVFSFARSGQTDQELFGQIDVIYDELSQKLTLAKRWANDYNRLFRATRRRREKIRGDLEDPMKDLGLVRWGYTLPDHAKEDLVRVVVDLLQAGDERLMEQCARLASRVELARTNIDECLVITAILWVLYEFNEIVRLIDELRRNSDQVIPASLVLFQAAAQIRATIAIGFEEKKTLVQRIWDLRESIPREHLGGYLLGLGYVLYRAWKNESLGEGVKKTSVAISSEALAWSEKSFSIGLEALDILPERSLAWAFAINHCVYVGMVIGKPRDEVEPYFTVLLTLQGQEVWNFRFDDTMGCYYLFDMEREWDSTPPAKRRGLDFSKRLALVRVYFDNAAKQDFGDIDLDEHVARLHKIESEWGRLQGES